jgi:hypothetical protein
MIASLRRLYQRCRTRCRCAASSFLIYLKYFLVLRFFYRSFDSNNALYVCAYLQASVLSFFTPRDLARLSGASRVCNRATDPKWRHWLYMHFGFHQRQDDWPWTKWGPTPVRQYRALVKTLCYTCREDALGAVLRDEGCSGRSGPHYCTDCGHKHCGPAEYWCHCDESDGSGSCNCD